MAGYGRTLQGLQEEARRLLGQAHEKASQERSRDRARAAEPSASTSVHEDAIDNARSRLDGARDRLDDIRDRRRGAENAAIDKLDDAQDQGIENDPWWKRAWDSVDRWVDEHADILKSISEVLKIVSAVAGVLSFIPVLNFVMGPIALIAGGAALLLDATLAATGNGDWKTLLVDGALMALPGVGRLVSRGVRTGRGGTQFTQVAYGSTRLSRAAINLRRGENMVQNGNVAVARYSRYGIPRKPIAVRNIPRGPGRAGKHSEQVLIETLGGRRGVRVKEVYSELEPCTLNFARCRTKLPEAFPDSKFSYSFEYGGDLTGAAATASRRRGTQALNDAVGGVFGG